METKVFELPKHPIKGKQQIVIERPSKDSVWYLVIDKERAVPLVNLENPKTAKDVLDGARDQNGESFVAQFVMGGFSKIAQEEQKVSC